MKRLLFVVLALASLAVAATEKIPYDAQFCQEGAMRTAGMVKVERCTEWKITSSVRQSASFDNKAAYHRWASRKPGK